MKLSKVICMVIFGIFMIASLSYAYNAMTNHAPATDGAKAEEAVAAQGQVERKGATEGGSSYHAWLDIIRADITELDFSKFKQMRNTNRTRPNPWSDWTLRAEWNGLIAGGVLKPKDAAKP